MQSGDKWCYSIKHFQPSLLYFEFLSCYFLANYTLLMQICIYYVGYTNSNVPFLFNWLTSVRPSISHQELLMHSKMVSQKWHPSCRFGNVWQTFFWTPCCILLLQLWNSYRKVLTDAKIHFSLPPPFYHHICENWKNSFSITVPSINVEDKIEKLLLETEAAETKDFQDFIS